MQYQTNDTRIISFEELDTPQRIKEEIPVLEKASQTVFESRQEIRACLEGSDPRLLVVVGPCSIHDPEAALEYAQRLLPLKKALASHMVVVMRVYFEKPRTTVGWKGLINDPHLDGSHDMSSGLRQARALLLQINALGMSCATEFLDPITPQYTADLVSWAAIGARTTESQTHREMASGLSMPVGFKNSTEGGLQVALDAMSSSKRPHAFLGIGQNGCTAVVKTTGNPDVHVVLRGGHQGPNYFHEDITSTQQQLVQSGFKGRRILVDCSHGNSNKDYTQQPFVCEHVTQQWVQGSKHILGVMLESHLVEGQQKLSSTLAYGKSITDGCIGWETTETLLQKMYDQMKNS